MDFLKVPTICCLKEILFKYNTGKLKLKVWKKICHANFNQNKAGALLINQIKYTSWLKKLQGREKNIT